MVSIIIIALFTISRNAGVSHGHETACSQNISMRYCTLHIMKRILPVFVIALAVACGSHGAQRPLADRGIINLSGWNFVRDGSIDLRGEWEFYRMRLVPPEDFAQPGSAGDPVYSFVPGRWNPGWKVYFPPYGRGYATYRLRVAMGDARPHGLGMRIERIPTACRLFVNGALLFESGRVATSPESTVPEYSESVVPLPRAGGIYDIVVHIANFHAPAGGFYIPIELGSLSSLRKSEQSRSSLAVLSASCFSCWRFFSCCSIPFSARSATTCISASCTCA
jgi:hypothetical protein